MTADGHVDSRPGVAVPQEDQLCLAAARGSINSKLSAYGGVTGKDHHVVSLPHAR